MVPLVRPPNLATELVAEAVFEQFGLRGDYTPLVSERDQNFCLTTAHAGRFLVKVTSPSELPATTEFQIAALRHLEKCGFAGVPRHVPTTSGDGCAQIMADEGSSLCLRVLGWVNGTLLKASDIGVEIARQLGQRLAALDSALEDVVPAGDSQASLWDTQRAGQLRGLLVHVDSLQTRRHVETVLDDFEELVVPVLGSMPRQAIHNDAHGENVLLDANGDVSGIIDFGDLLMAPRIIEVSTAAAYLRPTGGDPLQLIVPFVAGYHRISTLAVSERDILFDLVRTRLAMTIILQFWRLSVCGKSDPYLRKQADSEGRAFTFLQAISDFGKDRFRQSLL